MNVMPYIDDVLTLTPKQVAIKYGWDFCRELNQIYFYRRSHIFPDFDPAEYYDRIPSDSECQKIADERSLPLNDIKLGFIGRSALNYAGKTLLDD